MTSVEKRVYIIKTGRLKQKYHARFRAEGNNKTLAHTEKYTSRADLVNMLETYFPFWNIHG
jgi:uncharacterized protein YegP (UPF0339 family)